MINGEEIITTETHPFYVNNRGFVNAGELKVGDELLDSDGEVLFVENYTVELTKDLITVYNFQVEDFHTYYVGECGVWVHNAEGYSENLIPNKKDGLRRENKVQSELQEKYPESEGYKIESERLLRDSNGKKAIDPETGTGRRVDFVVDKDGNIVDSIEVTSKTADKTAQIAKETRIRENGGNYVKLKNGDIVKIPENITTRIERRD